MLKIDTSTEGSVTVITLNGQLIFGPESRSLSDQIKKLVSEGARLILIDLGGVGFIDSNGVGELVSGFSSVKRAEGLLKLCSPTKMVREVLRIVRLPTIIEITETRAAAIASFGAGVPSDQRPEPL